VQMSQARYISQAERARRLIDKAVAAWQRLQAFSMEHDELVDSLVLRGQELWLPHHETNGRQFRVTLAVSLHFPGTEAEGAQESVARFVQELEQQFTDEDGSLAVQVESR
jgi:hypothetical protein